MRTILRAIFALLLLLGGGGGDWAPAGPLGQAHESCCCGTPVGMPDSCPCPKPEGNQKPSTSACSSRATSAVAPAARPAQSQRRREPRPEPSTWAQIKNSTSAGSLSPQMQGRDPDLTRHLARLNTFRI